MGRANKHLWDKQKDCKAAIRNERRKARRVESSKPIGKTGVKKFLYIDGKKVTSLETVKRNENKNQTLKKGLAKEVIGANSEQQVTGITSDGHPFHCDTVSFNDNDFSVDPELLEILRATELEANSYSVSSLVPTRTNKEYQESETTWKTRMEAKEEEFKYQRLLLCQLKLEFAGIFNNHCESCRNESYCVIRCNTCRRHLCNECDEQLHTRLFTHQRICSLGNEFYKLVPTEFLDTSGAIVTKGVPIPLFEPISCNHCFAVGSVRADCNSKMVTVVTKEGRFDLNETIFRCNMCNKSRDVSNHEYLCSGYWLGSLSNNTYFFDESMLEMWYHLRHKTPGTSERKFVETLEEVSYDNDRINTINRTLFNRARREFEFFQHQTEKNVLRRHGDCTVCGDEAHGMHADAIRKLYRLESAKDRKGDSLYGDAKMASDEEQISHIKQIETRIPKAKENDSCGSSTFKAARIDSSNGKKLDITGLEMMSCTHGTIAYSANLFKGETFKHTHLQHLKALEKNTKFFCNDVVCKYWPYARKVGAMFPEIERYRLLTENMKPFLSRFHGKAHSWDCRVIWNGHWKAGAADMLGEEQEQVFAYMALFGTTTKHQSRASRRDDITCGIYYYNANKEKGRIKALCSWLATARKRAPDYEKKLGSLLIEKNLNLEDLPNLLKKLREQARLVKNKQLSRHWDVCALQKELEGECHMIKVLHTRNATFHDTCKARTKNRTVMSNKEKRVLHIVTLLKAKGITVTEESINSGIFPWHETTNMSLAESYEIIDTWMLGRRYREAIGLTQREMRNYIRSLTAIRTSLEQDIVCLNDVKPITSLNYSKAVLAKTEISKINRLIEDGVREFSISLKSTEIDPAEEDFLDQIENEEDILEALTDDESSEDENRVMEDEFDSDEESVNWDRDDQNYSLNGKEKAVYEYEDENADYRNEEEHRECQYAEEHADYGDSISG